MPQEKGQRVRRWTHDEIPPRGVLITRAEIMRRSYHIAEIIRVENGLNEYVPVLTKNKIVREFFDAVRKEAVNELMFRRKRKLEGLVEEIVSWAKAGGKQKPCTGA